MLHDPGWEEVDAAEHEQHTAVVNFISSRLEASQYARLNDLTSPQRLALFATVLKDRPAALAKLKELFNKFQNLEGLAQRAVIARLLTSVGEALADADVDTVLSASSAEFNEASVFGLVVQTLLKRDLGIGDLSAANRHLFLQAFAVHLQQSGQDSFASPNEVRTLVAELFAARIRSSDTPKAVEEEYYRTCRRHSGLTTERQYLDTTGNIDTPIDDTDKDARVGFSHNSLREYLVAEAAVDHLKGKAKFSGLKTARLTDAIADFVVGLAEHQTALVDVLSKAWGQRATSGDDWLFHLVYGFMRRDASVGRALLGRPPDLSGLDLSGYDLGSLDLRGADFAGAIAFDADFQQSDLRDVEFGDAILELVRFDGARLDNARFAATDVVSVYVHDTFNTRTTSVLSGQDAQQWLFSRGAIVRHPESLNPYLGRPWYEAAREVAKTLQRQIAGTRQEDSLVRGTSLPYREFASEFTRFLLKQGVLEVRLRDRGKRIVRVVPEHREVINGFADDGRIAPILKPFLDKYVRDS